MAGPSPRLRPRNAGRPHRDAGAALVETAVALVVVVALITAISVVGQQWGSGTRVDQLATRTVRLATGLADPPVSDLDLLAFVGAGLGRSSLERLVVYRPAAPGGAPAPACLALRPDGTVPTGVAGWCTAFGPGHLAAVASAPASVRASLAGCGPGSWEGAWCPSSRRVGDGGSGWIGILLEVRDPDRPAGWGGDEGGVRGSRAVAAIDPPPAGRP